MNQVPRGENGRIPEIYIYISRKSGSYDPFLRYWIKIYDLSGQVRDLAHPGYLAKAFVDTGVNYNAISRTLFEQLISRESVSEFIKG